MAVLLPLFLLEACVTPPKRALDPAARSVAQRDAIIVIPQGEIRAIIKPSTAGAAGGLIGALIDVGVNQYRANTAEDEVRPIRDGLAGYDFDRRALEAAKAAAAQIDWLNLRNITFTKDPSNTQLLARFDQSGADQLFLVAYSYTFSPDFAQLAVALRADLFPKNPPPGVQQDHRLARGNELYEEQFVDVVDAPAKSDNADANVAQWAADNAQATRAALDSGIAKVHELLVRSLSQSPEAAAALDLGQETKVSDRRGALVERDASGTLIYQKNTGIWVFGRENGP